MRRIVSLLLTLLLLSGCAAAVPAFNASSGPAATPAVTERAKAAGPFLQYRFYEQDNWEDLTQAVMFEADLDQDGVAEPVSFTLDHEAWATSISWGESTVTLDVGDDLVEAAILDLDTQSPFYNLLAVLDYGSDSYVTVELHPENGQLVQGTVVEGPWEWEDDALWFFERTDFLGTASGKRTYSGDGLTPDSEWLEMCDIPTAEELAEERDDLIEFGTLLHTVRPVPCTINGQPGTIPADSYVYRLRFRYDDDLTEVALPDGTVAQIACTQGEHGWPYLIDGMDIQDCFDNLFFAD